MTEAFQLVDRELTVRELDRRPQRVVMAKLSVGDDVDDVVAGHAGADVCDSRLDPRQQRRLTMTPRDTPCLCLR
jgi:hypothetical protein